MSDALRDALKEARKAQRVIGSAPVFPAPKYVAAAGGWRDEGTMFTSSQQGDGGTITQVVLHPTQRLVGT